MKTYKLVKIINNDEYEVISKHYTLPKAKLRKTIYERTYPKNKYMIFIFNK